MTASDDYPAGTDTRDPDGATDPLAETPELVGQLCDEFEAWLREDGGYLELEARHIVRACLIQAKAVIA